MKPRRPQPTLAAGLTVEPRLRGVALPPLTATEPPGGWTVSAGWNLCRSYASGVEHETASPAGIATAAWLALSQAVDHSRGVTAASPRSLVRQEIEGRLREPEPTLDSVAYALAIDPPPF
jgi:hypothetical protein